MKKMISKNPGTVGPCNSASSMDGMIVQHAGTVLSFSATLVNGGRSLKITFSRGTDQKQQTINVERGSSIEMFCPSVEGTVMVCVINVSRRAFLRHLNRRMPYGGGNKTQD